MEKGYLRREGGDVIGSQSMILVGPTENQLAVNRWWKQTTNSGPEDGYVTVKIQTGSQERGLEAYGRLDGPHGLMMIQS